MVSEANYLCIHNQKMHRCFALLSMTPDLNTLSCRLGSNLVLRLGRLHRNWTVLRRNL